jgi:hypothetical protein
MLDKLVEIVKGVEIIARWVAIIVIGLGLLFTDVNSKNWHQYLLSYDQNLTPTAKVQ